MTTLRTRLTGVRRHRIADALGKSRPFISQIVTGARKPSAETIAELSAAFGLNDAEIGASVREMYPDAFQRIPPVLATDKAA